VRNFYRRFAVEAGAWFAIAGAKPFIGREALVKQKELPLKRQWSIRSCRSGGTDALGQANRSIETENQSLHDLRFYGHTVGGSRRDGLCNIPLA